MIPKPARDLIDLNLMLSRKAEIDEYAERYLHAAESMLAFALSCEMLSAREHCAEIATISLIRAQRHARAEELKVARKTN